MLASRLTTMAAMKKQTEGADLVLKPLSNDELATITGGDSIRDHVPCNSCAKGSFKPPRGWRRR